MSDGRSRVRIGTAAACALAFVLAAGCAPYRLRTAAAPPAPSRPTKNVSFAIVEDYEKGRDLEQIARDFELMNELEVRVMRCSFGWDDYEPERGRYDFAWLERFAKLARDHGIELRPCLGHTPAWAGAPGTDDQAWNDPPADYADFERFAGRLASTLAQHPNVISYEIYKEQNSRAWWDGDVGRYAETLRRGAAAIRTADAGALILLGGLSFPDDGWLRALAEAGPGDSFDITPFHAYPETWPDSVRVEEYLGDRYDSFVAVSDSLGGARPIWISETGFATTDGKSERDQANWWARAAATFLAEPRIEHLGIHEIRDLPPESAAIGGEPNHHFGLVRADGTRKLAFRTVDLLTDLLDTGTLTVADADLEVTVRTGPVGDLHGHLFLRPDGKQVLFVWDNEAKPVVDVTVIETATRAYRCDLDGSVTPTGPFSGGMLKGIRLVPGEVAIFRLDP